MPRQVSSSAMNPEDTSVMFEMLQSIRAQFESAPASMRRLRSAIDIVDSDAGASLGESGSHYVIDNYPVVKSPKGPERCHALFIGVAVDPVVGLINGQTPGVINPGRKYQSMLFGFKNDLDESHRAIELFSSFAEPAWRCLPAEVREGLRLPEYIEPGHPLTDCEKWIATLYAICWQQDAPAGLKANRVLRFSNGATYDIESIIRMPVDAPPTSFGLPDTRTQKHCLAHIREFIGENISEQSRLGIHIPPPRFSAFLEPDVFLASVFAIQFVTRKYSHIEAGDQRHAIGAIHDRRSHLTPSGDATEETTRSDASNTASAKSARTVHSPSKTHSRGHRHRAEAVAGWTVMALCRIGDISRPTFSEIRAKAGVDAPPAGAHGYEFTLIELRAIRDTAAQASGKRVWKHAAEEWTSHIDVHLGK